MCMDKASVTSTLFKCIALALLLMPYRLFRTQYDKKNKLSSSFYEFWQCWLFGYDRNIQRLFSVRSNTFSLENTIYITSIKSTSINWLFVVRASPHLQCSFSSKQPRNSPCLWPDIREFNADSESWLDTIGQP